MQQQMSMQIDAHVRSQWEANPKNGWIREIDLDGLRVSNPDSFALVNGNIQKEYAAFRGQWPKFNLTPELKNVYKTQGGAPFLDGSYTVFGEVIQGMEFVRQIENTPVAGANQPVKEVKMTVTVLK